MPSTVSQAAPSATTDVQSSEESTLCFLTLPNAKPAWPLVSASGRTRSYQDVTGDFLIDSWSKVRPGDLLTDNRGVIEEVLKLTPIPDTNPVRYNIRLRRGDGEMGFSTETEVHDDRDFTVRRGLIVIARHSDGTSEEFADKLASGASPAALRKEAADRLLDSLANRSLAFCDHAVARFTPERRGDALIEVRHYQGLLKQFKMMLDDFDSSSYEALSILTTLARREQSNRPPLLSPEETPFSLGVKVARALRDREGKETALVEELSAATVKISDAWQALRAMRTESWVIKGDDFGEEARSVIPAVSTTLYRGKAPQELVEALSMAVRGEHRALDSEEAALRGIIWDTFSPRDLNEALRRGAHLLVSYNAFYPNKVEGFMLYYPPMANLPEKLQVLRDEHPNISAAVVDLVFVATDAPKQTFNHLFWGHRIALQATSDAKIHVGELLMQNLSSYSALVRRGAIAELEAESRGEGWQIMTVAIDVHRIKVGDNLMASELIANREKKIPEILRRSQGDTTPAALVEEAIKLSNGLHVHIPDWKGAIESSAHDRFTDCLKTGLTGFSGLVTGPMRAQLVTIDGALTAVRRDDAAAAMTALTSGLDRALVVGLFPYPRASARYQTYQTVAGTLSTFGFVDPAHESQGELVACDPAIARRIKIGVEEGADLRSRGEKTAIDLTIELERRSLEKAESCSSLLIVPEEAIAELPELKDWIDRAQKSPSFHLAVMRSEDALSNAAARLISGKGIYHVSGPEQLRELVVSLQSRGADRAVSIS